MGRCGYPTGCPTGRPTGGVFDVSSWRGIRRSPPSTVLGSLCVGLLANQLHCRRDCHLAKELKSWPGKFLKDLGFGSEGKRMEKERAFPIFQLKVYKSCAGPEIRCPHKERTRHPNSNKELCHACRMSHNN